MHEQYYYTNLGCQGGRHYLENRLFQSDSPGSLEWIHNLSESCREPALEEGLYGVITKQQYSSYSMSITRLKKGVE